MQKSMFPDWHDKLDTVQNYNENNMDTEHATQELPQREEWMLLIELVPGSLNAIDESHETLHTTYNWQNDRLKFKDSQIREMSSWLRTHNQAFTPKL